MTIREGSIRDQANPRDLSRALDTINDIILDPDLSAADAYQCVCEELERIGYQKR